MHKELSDGHNDEFNSSPKSNQDEAIKLKTGRWTDGKPSPSLIHFYLSYFNN